MQKAVVRPPAVALAEAPLVVPPTKMAQVAQQVAQQVAPAVVPAVVLRPHPSTRCRTPGRTGCRPGFARHTSRR
jgi:hypothetical protein